MKQTTRTHFRLKQPTGLYLGILLLLLTLRLPAQTITTVVGGDGSLGLVSDVAIDAAGNLFIADYARHRIRKVSYGGVITTIAGTGTAGFSGDGGLATNAMLDNPTGIAVDRDGNLFIADSYNQRIRKVGPDGNISTVAGSGIRASGYTDIGDGGPAINAKLQFPERVAIDGNGNLLISDTGDGLIRKVAVNGIITTVAGNIPYGGAPGGFSGDGGLATSARLNSPTGITVDAGGNLFVADRVNARIRKISTDGIITTVAGGGYIGGFSVGFGGDNGLAISAIMNAPDGVAVDGNGNIFIGDENNIRIRKVAADGIITTVAGTGVIGFNGDGGLAINTNLNHPKGIGLDPGGNLFIADRSNFRIRRMSAPVPPSSVSISPANPVAVCPGSPFSLSATATNFTPTSYAWSSQPAGLAGTGPAPVFTAPAVNSPTVYTLNVAATNGTLSATGSVTLTVNVEAYLTISPNDGLLTLTHQTPVQQISVQNSVLPDLLWSTGETTPAISVSAGGVYSVTATTAAGCAISKSTTVIDLTGPVTGPDCGYLVLNGASGHVQISDLDAIDSGPYPFPVFGSISFLIKPNSFVAGMTLISTGDPANPNDGLWLGFDPQGRLSLRIGNATDATTITSNVPISTNWQHIAAIWNQDDNTLELFHNGIRVADGISGGGVGALWPATYRTVRIGTDKITGQTFDGLIDDVAFWDQKLYDTDISSLIVNGTTGTEENLRAYYNLNRSGEGAGLTVTNNAVATAGLYTGITVGTATAPRFVDSNCSSPATVATTPLVSNSLCKGAPVSVSFTVSGTLNTGNTFSVQLSDANGSFAGSPRVIGTASGTAVRTILATLPDPLAAGTSYRVRVVASDPVLTGTDNGENITVWQRAAITQQPDSGSSVCAGASVSIPASVTGSYYATQWYFRPPGLGSTILTGQTSPTLTLSNVQATNAGTYELFVSGPCQSNLSTPFVLTISSGVSITAQPASASSGCANTPVSVSVGAAGSGLTYQWYKGANPIPSQTTAVLSFSSAQPADNGTYYVTVTGSCGNPQTSQFFALTISPRPATPALTGVSRLISTTSATPLSLLPFVQALAGNVLSFSGVGGLLNPATASVSLTGTQSFSVTQLSTSGCISPVTVFTITVQQSTTPPPVTPPSQVVCRSSSVVLTSSTTGAHNEWYRNGKTPAHKLPEVATAYRGTKTQSLTLVNAQAEGTFYCKVFAANGSFTWTGAVLVYIDFNCPGKGARQAASDLAEVPLSVVLTPNPVVDGQLQAVVTGADDQPLSVHILGLRGQVLSEQRWPAAEVRQRIDWNITSMPVGQYLLRVQTPGQSRTIKFIRQ